MEDFHHLDHGDVRAGVDELMVGLGGVGPAPGVGKGVELRLAYLSAGFAEEDVVIGVRIERRIEIDEIDGCVRKLFRVPLDSNGVVSRTLRRWRVSLSSGSRSARCSFYSIENKISCCERERASRRVKR